MQVFHRLLSLLSGRLYGEYYNKRTYIQVVEIRAIALMRIGIDVKWQEITETGIKVCYYKKVSLVLRKGSITTIGNNTNQEVYKQSVYISA